MIVKTAVIVPLQNSKQSIQNLRTEIEVPTINGKLSQL